MVEIPESYLLTFLGVIFVPLFIFLIKMIIEQGNTKLKVDRMIDHIEESKTLIEHVHGHETEIKLIRQRLNQIEDELKHLFRRERISRSDRDKGYIPDGDITNNE